jgi:hypothetical protein
MTGDRTDDPRPVIDLDSWHALAEAPLPNRGADPQPEEKKAS